MAAKDDVLKDIEEKGRLSIEQEDALYRVIMREDAFSYEPTNMLVSKLLANELICSLVKRGYLTYHVANPNGLHEVASISTTRWGIEYGSLFANEIATRQYQA